MAHEGKDDLRVGGMKLWARFTLLMTLSLTVVMAAAGAFLYNSSAKVTRAVQEQSLLDSVQLTAQSTMC